MKRRLRTVFFVLVLSLIFTGVAYAQTGNDDTTITVTTVLAPLAAAALGIERAMETLWGIVETVGNFFMKDYKDPQGNETDWKEAPKYKEFKTWAAALISLVAGVIVARTTNLMMFSLIGFENVSPSADIVITGIVIGSGSKFTHDVIGIFSESKKFVEHAQGFMKAKKENELKG